ncbi:MAG: hypothetical protein A2W21_11765 [Betaproteobacteria bacterium RBG_16_66_20]|nr:MAG: hypothetical protein A2W21_11765 [Betaproteobacteria bacterium RBG_16_66_20]
MRTASKIAAAAALLLLGGCVSMPSGPGVMVLPGTGKSFDQFRADDMDCRQFASSQVGGSTPDQAAESSALKSAAVGTAVGAVAGAIVGGHRGAAAGAGTGLIVGGVAGAGAAGGSQRTLQQRYDFGYQQCMYAKGHRIPTSGRFENSTRRPSASYTPPPPPAPTAGAIPPPPTAGAIPPPPPGAPPPPPPGVK